MRAALPGMYLADGDCHHLASCLINTGFPALNPFSGVSTQPAADRLKMEV